jgi:Alginate lyase
VRVGLSVRVCVLVAAVCAVASCSTSAPPPAPAPAPPSGAPAAPSLDGWKLTLPTVNEKGNAAIVDPAQPSPPYLTTDPAGALVFWAPVNGATTKNSDHARTELDSLTNFTAGSGRHSLTGTATVSQVPTAAKDVIIAQIHGADDISSVPFVMLHWDDGQLKVVVKTVQKGDDGQDYPLVSGIPLGAKFDFGIVDNGDGTLSFTAKYGDESPQANGPLPPAFAGETVRFQAGAYQQSISSGTAAPDDGARVTFSALTVG